MIKLLFSLLLFTIPVASGCQINYNSPHLQTARDDNYGETPEPVTNTDDKTNGTTFSKSGVGDDVIKNLAFKKGVTIIYLSYQGNESFTASLFDNTGTKIETLIQTTQDYTGSTLLKIPKDADNYLLEIKATGKWQVSFTEVN